MRILLVDPGASWSTADVCDGLRDGLAAAGADVRLFRLGNRLDASKRWLQAAYRRQLSKPEPLPPPTVADIVYHAGIGALEQALRYQADVVLVVSAMFFHPDVIIMLRRAGLRVVVLFTESPYDADPELKIARLVDGCWTNERTAVDTFRAVCPRVGYLRHAWRPGVHTAAAQPGDADVPSHDVVFVGSAFRERVEWLSAVDWSGIDLGLYGNWSALPSRSPLRRFVRGATPLPNKTAAALYRRASLSLNLYRTSQGWGKDAPPIAGADSLNPRAYELAACGAVTISTPRAEVGERFGGLVPIATSPVEASSLIRALLADADERARIRRALPAIVAADSWNERAMQVLGDVQALRSAA